MNFWLGIIISTAFLVATVAIFSTKLFFPYHRIIALVVYAVGWIPFLYSVFLRKHWLLQHKAGVGSFISAFWAHIIFGIILLLALYLFLVLFPITRSAFLGLSNEDIAQNIEKDKTLILYLDKRLENSMEAARKQEMFSIDFKNISGTEKEKLNEFWVEQIEVLLELDLLKERYKTFYQINAITRTVQHAGAFNNGYAAFVMQHYHALQLTEAVKDNNMITYLNEGFPEND